jgi:hypothetical protein
MSSPSANPICSIGSVGLGVKDLASVVTGRPVPAPRMLGDHLAEAKLLRTLD